MSFEIQYHALVVSEDIPAIPKRLKLTIEKAIEVRLSTVPEKFGKPLRKSLAGYRKLRVGDYGIIFRIENKFIKIFAIQNRKVVYRNLFKRI